MNRSMIDESGDRFWILPLVEPVELSCKNEYAILALIELAAHHTSGEPLQIRQIAAQQNIPDRYLEQLLAALRREAWCDRSVEPKVDISYRGNPGRLTCWKS